MENLRLVSKYPTVFEKHRIWIDRLLKFCNITSYLFSNDLTATTWVVLKIVQGKGISIWGLWRKFYYALHRILPMEKAMVLSKTAPRIAVKMPFSIVKRRFFKVKNSILSLFLPLGDIQRLFIHLTMSIIQCWGHKQRIWEIF